MIKRFLVCTCLFIIVCTAVMIINNKISFTDITHTNVYNSIANDLNTDIIEDSIVLINKNVLTFNTSTTLTLVEEKECIDNKSMRYIKEGIYTFYTFTTTKYNSKEFYCHICTTYIVEKF